MAKLFPSIGTYILVLWFLFIFLAPKAFAPATLDYRSIDAVFPDNSNAETSDDDEEVMLCLRYMKVGDRSEITDCDEYCREGGQHFGEWWILKELVEEIGGQNVFDSDTQRDYSDSQNPDLVQNGDNEFCFACTEVYS